MKKDLRYLVIERCDDYEQPLGLQIGKELPDGGVLTWTDGPRAAFTSRDLAKQAIDRSEHYRLAFGQDDERGRLPEKKFCKIIPVELLP